MRYSESLTKEGGEVKHSYTKLFKVGGAVGTSIGHSIYGHEHNSCTCINKFMAAALLQNSTTHLTCSNQQLPTH